MHKTLQYLLPIVLILCTGRLSGQTLSLYDIDPSGYPTIKAKVLALDASGNPYRPNINDLELTEGGTRRTIRSITCPEPKPIVPISSVLTIDISSSMREHVDRNIKIARAAAHAWIDAMPLGISECAITSFHQQSFLNQDFTIDAIRLRAAVDDLAPGGGTAYDAAFISPVIGAVPVALGGKHKRVIVFLTDGRATGMEDEIVRQANDGDVTIHCVTVGLPAPPILKGIAARTGGLWFENVTTPEEAVEIYRLILGQSQGGEPCEIEWESGPACTPLRIVTLKERSLPTEVTTTYTAPPQAVTELTLDKTEIFFGTVTPGTTLDKSITLSTGTAPVRILSVTSSDPRIKAVANGAPPAYTIPPNADYDLIFRFEPTDSSLVVAEITIEIEGCTKTFYASGGTWRDGVTPPDIQLVVPNGGERFPVGSRTEIRWRGVLPTDTVRLDYSTNAGQSWRLISDKATGLSHDWIVPNTPSETCLARVSIDSFSSGGGSAVSRLRIRRVYTYGEHLSQGSITAARFSPDGKYVATATDNPTDQIRLWETLDGKSKQTFTPAGGVRDLEFSADGKYLAAVMSNGGWKVFKVNTSEVISGVTTNATAVGLTPPGGSILATGDAAGMITIWSLDWVTRSGTTLRSFQTGVGEITSIELHPQPGFNELAVTGMNNDSIKFFTLNGTPASPATLPNFAGAKTHTPGLGITSARYSPDGNRITSAGNGGDAYIWDRFGGKWRDSLSGHNDAAFSFDGSKVVTGAGDLLFSGGNLPDTVWVWNAETGEKLGYAFDPTNGHSKAITSVDMTRLSGREYILTAGRDRTAIVWEIEKESGEGESGGSDVSDNLWAIVDARIEASSVDFGEVLVGSAKDSTLVGYIRNSGGIAVEIEGLNIVGGNSSSFDIISGLLPFTIAPGDVHEVELRFAPSAIGSHNTTLEIYSAVDTLTPALLGKGVAPQLRIDAKIVDFGLVEVGDLKDSLVQVVVTNIGSAPLTITSTVQNGPDMESFFILSGEAPFTLAVGESHSMNLRFAPVVAGRRSGTILFGFNGPG